VTVIDGLTMDDGTTTEWSLAERLKTRREERGISQSQAARELDVARTAYRLWEMEAAHPAPDRWRVVARWLGVSITTLLLAEGLITDEERFESDAADARFEAETGESSDVATEHETGNFFRQAQSYLDRSLELGLINAQEAGHFRDVFDRIRRGLPESPSR
jgi:transcriptional regulator with XRE-family HTH domain